MESQQVSNHTSFRSLGAIPMSFATRSKTVEIEGSVVVEVEGKVDDDNDVDETKRKKKKRCCCRRTSSNSLVEIAVFVFVVLGLTVLSVVL